MLVTISGGYAVFPDGTRVRTISGAQEWDPGLGDQPADLVTAYDVDFVLNVGGAQVDSGGGVPYGDPEAAGYVGLSDALRSGESADAYVGSVATNSSLSDILRSYGIEGTVSGPSEGGTYTTGGADPTNSISGTQSWNITDVIDSAVKGIAAIGQIALSAVALSKSGGSTGGSSANPAAGAQGSFADSIRSLGQRIFGYSPGPSGNPTAPAMMTWLFIATLGGLLIFLLAKKA